MKDKPKIKNTKSDASACFEGVMNTLAGIKGLVRDEAVEPAGKLFALYNSLVASGGAGPDRAEIRSQLEAVRADFAAISRKLNALKDPADISFKLKIVMNAAREKCKKHIVDSQKAAEALTAYVDTGDKSKLAAAYEFLSPMAE